MQLKLVNHDGCSYKIRPNEIIPRRNKEQKKGIKLEYKNTFFDLAFLEINGVDDLIDSEFL